jgi:hypothetical protein
VVIEKDIQEFAMTEDVMKGESQVANLAYQWAFGFLDSSQF